MSSFISILSIFGFLAYNKRDHIRRDPRKFLSYAGVLAVLVAVLIGIKDHGYAKVETYFRQQFHLPDGAQFAELSKPLNGRMPDRAIVEFSDRDWRDFVGGLNDPSRPTPFFFDFPADPDRHAEIAHWKDIAWIMTANPSPKHITDVPNVRNGKILCVAYVAERPDGVRSCYDPLAGQRLYSYVVGILDFDKRQLHLRYKGHLEI